MTWRTPGHFVLRTELCGTAGQTYLKSVKMGLCREKDDREP